MTQSHFERFLEDIFQSQAPLGSPMLGDIFKKSANVLASQSQSHGQNSKDYCNNLSLFWGLMSMLWTG